LCALAAAVEAFKGDELAALLMRGHAAMIST
jgi:hypothetical protein